MHERTKMYKGSNMHEETFALRVTYAQKVNFAQTHFCTDWIFISVFFNVFLLSLLPFTFGTFFHIFFYN